MTWAKLDDPRREADERRGRTDCREGDLRGDIVFDGVKYLEFEAKTSSASSNWAMVDVKDKEAVGRVGRLESSVVTGRSRSISFCPPAMVRFKVLPVSLEISY